VAGAYGYRTGSPGASHLSLSGLRIRKPRLRFVLAGPAGSAPIQSLALTLPAGLSFVKNHKQLNQGITIRGTPGYTVTAKGKSLRVHLDTTHASVAIGPMALSETKALAARAQRARKSTSKPLVVRATVRATDITGSTTTIVLVFRVR